MTQPMTQMTQNNSSLGEQMTPAALRALRAQLKLDRAAAKTFAKRSAAQKRAWRKRKAKLREISRLAKIVVDATQQPC